MCTIQQTPLTTTLASTASMWSFTPVYAASSSSCLASWASATSTATKPLECPSAESSTSLLPGPNDVVCGRGKGSYNRPANQRFRNMCQDSLPAYVKASVKADRSAIVTQIIEQIQSTGGKFLCKERGGEWKELSAPRIREKVGHAIREILNSQHQVGKPSKAKSVFRQKQNDLIKQQRAIFEQLLCNTL